MRQIGLIDYMKAKTSKNAFSFQFRLKEFVQMSSGYKLETDDDYNKASLEILNLEHDDVHHLILDYCIALSKSELLPGTMHGIFSALRNWLNANRYIIDPIELREIKTILPRNVIVTDDDFLTVNKIRAIVSQSDVLLRAFILVACSSGARIGEIISLSTDSIKYSEEDDVYYFKVKYSESKSGKPHKYFISHEAYKEVCEYLKIRKQYQDRRVVRSKVSLGLTVENSDLIFQLHPKSIRGRLVAAVKKAGIYAKDEDSRRATIHPHSFRKFADTVFKEHLGVNMGNELIGHDEGLSTSYRRYDPKAVAEAYKQVEPYVTIMAPADYVEMKTHVSAEVDKIRVALASQSVEMTEIKNRLAETEELLALTLGNNKE